VRLLLTVARRAPDASTDLLVDLDDDATVGELADHLPRAVDAAADTVGVVSMVSRALRGATGGAPSGRPRLYVGGQELDPTLPVRDSELRDGSLVALDDPSLSVPAEPHGELELRVVGGPGAGAVRWIGVGDVVVGGDPASGVVLPPWGDQEAPPVVVTVRVDLDGDATVTPAEGVEVSIDGEPVEEPTAWEVGTLLRAGGRVLELRRPQPADAAVQPSEDGIGLDFNRPPRLLPPTPETRFTLPTEPKPPRGRGLPIIAMIAPLIMAAVMVMVLGSLRYAIFGLLSPLIALGSYFQGKSGGKRTFREQLAEYKEHKEQVETDAREALVLERTLRRAQAPDPAEVAMVATGPRHQMWERRRDDPDYLSLRIGLAELESQVVLEDPAQLQHRRKVAWTVPDAPVTVGLARRGVVGVAGDPGFAGPVAAWMLAQAAVLHTPRDLQVCVLTTAEGEATWDWVRWLPHARPAFGQDVVALVGTDADSLGRRVSELQALVTERVQRGRDQAAPEPDVVVVLDGARRLRFLPGLVQVLKQGPAVGVYAICVDSQERLLPEECHAVVVQTAPGRAFLREQREDAVEDVLVDLVRPGWFARVSRALAPIRDVTDDGADSALPSSSRLLDVIGLEPPTSEAIQRIWTTYGRTTQAAVGDSLDGPFAIDFSRDGPHGLVAGTTGSGKSELLQTIVASLAVVNRPDAMTFVLVDYKGGSAFKDCVRLPHTVGMVTDLDTHLVERALESLGAELHRREHILADAGAKDIEDYTDLAERRDLAPMPRLMIVIDEFASMVRDLPDFVTGLVNIAQRGRSLGIHLVLATQRPGGVVSPEIRANTNLRIALRVTDKAESSDVIDAPDAALIAKTTPGRAYVRLGHASLVPFQSGRVGGRRPGTRATVAKAEPWFVPLDFTDLGRPSPTRPKPPEDAGDVDVTDLSVLVEAITRANEALGYPAPHRPWLEALPGTITLDDLPAPREVTTDLPAVAWALADLPRQQAQRAEAISLETFGHKLVVGSGRSGRTQTLRTIAGALADRISARDLHLYALDCGSGGLLPLADLPHCGAVVQRTQPERVLRLLQRLLDEVAARQEVLASGGFADLTEQRSSVPPDERLPHVVLLLDRWEGFLSSVADLDGGKPQSAIMTLLSDGAGVGVHVVIAGDRTLGTFKMMSLTEDRLVLRMNERSDYSTLGLNPRTLPEELGEGRGFAVDGVVETQVAVLPGELSGQGQAAAVREIAARARVRDADVPRDRRPFRVDVLPATISWADALAYREGEPAAPMFALLGVGGDDLEALGPDLAATPVFMLGGPPKSGRSTALLSMTLTLLRAGTEVAVIAPRPSPLRGLEGRPGVRGVLTDAELSRELLDPLLAGDGRMVLVIDDAELHKDTPVAAQLKAYIRSAADAGRGLVVGGTSADLSSGFAGWHAEARKARSGAVLSPQQMADGDLVGVRLPRSAIGDQVKPGRGLLHVGGGQLATVVVARPSAADVEAVGPVAGAALHPAAGGGA
jgi:S-DNA-T family DNA segregation ATPase FtsK/SpoIIIE